MTTIRARCPRCEEVEVPAASIVLNVPAGAVEGTYSFTCPGCRARVEKPADRRVVLLLRSAGVEEGTDPFEEHLEGPPLTLDDLIDFHFLLQRDDWFVQLLATSA